MQTLKVLAIGLTALALEGCGNKLELIGRPGMGIVRQGELPPPTTADLIQPERAYLIGPSDKVLVDVYGVPELSRTVQVDASGRISMPLVGTIAASGKTPAELANSIAASLRGRYVRDPQVTVNLTETMSAVVTVDGEVKKAGVYPVYGKMTLTRAIANAEGTTEFAASNFVVVFRRVDNQDMAALYDLRAIRAGLYPDPDIYANDTVWVGEARARRVFREVLGASGVLALPLITLIQRF